MSALPEPVKLEVASASGSISAHGAHVCAWTPTGFDDVLFMSRQAVFDSESAIRGGIPLIFPWFGPGRLPGMSPAHGFARTAAWQLVRVDEAADAATIEYRLTSADASSPWFTAPFSATLTATFGAELEVTLAVTNAGTQEFSYEDALHAYFRVGDVEQIEVRGLEGCEYVDKTLGEGAPLQHQADAIRITGETDRVYASSGAVTIVDPVLGRRLEITKHGSRDTVVWNPWVDRARALPDLADDEWRSFVCVEPANARERAVVLAPGSVHVTSVRVAVADLR